MKVIIGYSSAETYVKINGQYSHVYVKSNQSVGYFQESFFSWWESITGSAFYSLHKIINTTVCVNLQH